MKNLNYITVALLLIFSLNAKTQEGLSTERWLQDDLTISFNNGETRNYFSGIRLLFEPRLGGIVQFGENRFKSEQFTELSKFGIEVNLHKAWTAIQLHAILPSTIAFDDQSPVRLNGMTLDTEGVVDIDFGLGMAFSFMDGIFSVGYGFIQYDSRDFDKLHVNYSRSVLNDGYFSINVQPVSAVRKIVKSVKIIQSKK